jgi:hypothetical protein
VVPPSVVPPPDPAGDFGVTFLGVDGVFGVLAAPLDPPDPLVPVVPADPVVVGPELVVAVVVVVVVSAAPESAVLTLWWRTACLTRIAGRRGAVASDGTAGVGAAAGRTFSVAAGPAAAAAGRPSRPMMKARTKAVTPQAATSESRRSDGTTALDHVPAHRGKGRLVEMGGPHQFACT